MEKKHARQFWVVARMGLVVLVVGIHVCISLGQLHSGLLFTDQKVATETPPLENESFEFARGVLQALRVDDTAITIPGSVSQDSRQVYLIEEAAHHLHHSPLTSSTVDRKFAEGVVVGEGRGGGDHSPI